MSMWLVTWVNGCCHISQCTEQNKFQNIKAFTTDDMKYSKRYKLSKVKSTVSFLSAIQYI